MFYSILRLIVRQSIPEQKEKIWFTICITKNIMWIRIKNS